MTKNLNYIAMKDALAVRVLGRTTDRKEPLTLFWTGSGVEFEIQAGELWVELTSDYERLEPWISIQVNGAWISRQMVLRGTHKLCIFCGMNPEKVKQVRIIKDTQAMSGDERCLLQLHGFETDGTLLPPKERTMKIEWIGDSITSGEGTIGAKEEEDWIPMFFSALRDYAVLTSDALDAEFRIISQSGWGVLSSWDNNPQYALPDYYHQICGVINGERNELLGAKETNDFTKWQPEVVVVNLGTNDSAAFRLSAQKAEIKEKFVEKVKNFLKQLRECNPKAQLIWAYGMLGTELLHPIYEAIELYRMETKDLAVHLLVLPEMTPETAGARSHPGEACHREAAGLLTKYIRSLMERTTEENCL